MAKERSLFRTVLLNFINSLRPRRFWGTRVGVDYNGTQYYEIPLSKDSTKQRPPRWFIPKKESDFTQDIPPEWEAWLRYRRADPPTEEEVLNTCKRILATQEAAAELTKKSNQPDDSTPVTDKEFPVYKDVEGMPGATKYQSRES